MSSIINHQHRISMAAYQRQRQRRRRHGSKQHKRSISNQQRNRRRENNNTRCSVVLLPLCIIGEAMTWRKIGENGAGMAAISMAAPSKNNSVNGGISEIGGENDMAAKIKGDAGIYGSDDCIYYLIVQSGDIVLTAARKEKASNSRKRRKKHVIRCNGENMYQSVAKNILAAIISIS